MNFNDPQHPWARLTAAARTVKDDRDGVARFYDINALSNFVANPIDVLGWDPHDRLVDFLKGAIGTARKAA